MTTTELLPALLYESLPKPSPYPFDEPPAAAESRQPHRFAVKVRIPYYPGVAYQAPTPGYPPEFQTTRRKPAPSQLEAADPRTPRRAGTLAGLTGYDIRDMLIRAATPPEPVSLLNPTGEFARQVDAVHRAWLAEEAIPKQHLPKRRLALRLWRFLPVLWLVLKCRHCGQHWPCHPLTRHLTSRLRPAQRSIAPDLYDLSTHRRRERSRARSRTAKIHRPTPRWRDRRRPKIEARLLKRYLKSQPRGQSVR